MEPRFSNVVLLHGKYELPNGTVAHLEEIIKRMYPGIRYSRPYIPNVPTSEALVYLRQYLPALKSGSLIIGVERGGLLACRLQREFPALDFHVFAINAPTVEDGVSAGTFRNRCAVFSSKYISALNAAMWGVVADWAFDLDWLSTGKNHYYPLSYLISNYMQGNDMQKAVSLLFPTPTP